MKIMEFEMNLEWASLKKYMESFQSNSYLRPSSLYAA